MRTKSQSKLPTFERERHIRYFTLNLKKLPHQYSSLDTNRLTLIHFSVQSLDLLGFFENDKYIERFAIDKEAIINWIYNLQTLPSSPASTSTSRSRIKEKTLKESSSSKNVEDDTNTSKEEEDAGERVNETTYWQNAGFKGGPFLGGKFCLPVSSSPIITSNANTDNNNNNNNNNNSKTRQKTKRFTSPSCLCYEGWKYDHGHIAMTYVALCTLLTLGDDLSRLDKRSIIKALSQIQLPDGSFQSIYAGSERDMRFLYCACAISFMLDDWSGVDIPRAVGYIQSCRSYDGGIGLITGQEGHGGSTFCAVASLVLMGKLDEVINDANDKCDMSWRDELLKWCVSRQIYGMQGRPNKDEDTCYSYWIGGTLRLLGWNDELLDREKLTHFVLDCQTDMGGFSKLWCGMSPDLLHSFYSLAWLSLSQDDVDDGGSGLERKNNFKLKQLDCALGFAKRAK